MKLQTQRRLNKLMLRFDEIRAQDEPSETQHLQERFHTLSADTIEPLMRTFGEILESHGHGVRIYGRPMSVGSGGFSQDAETAMHVFPKSRETAGVAATGEYKISFTYATAEHKILVRVTDGIGTSSSSRHNLHPMDGVTDELIEAELIEMVEHVFRAQEAALAAGRSADAPSGEKKAQILAHPAIRAKA